MVVDGIPIVSIGIDQPHSVMVPVAPVICKLVPTCTSQLSVHDAIRYRVSWRGKSDLRELAAMSVQLCTLKFTAADILKAAE